LRCLALNIIAATIAFVKYIVEQAIYC
jgi:hypothetical protein